MVVQLTDIVWWSKLLQFSFGY